MAKQRGFFVGNKKGRRRADRALAEANKDFKKKEVKQREPIKLEKKSTARKGVDILEKGVEFVTGADFQRTDGKIDLGKTLKESGGRIATQAALAGVGGGLISKGAKVIDKGTDVARITRMKSAHEFSTKTGKLMPRGSIQTQRSFVGSPTGDKFTKLASRIPVKVRKEAGRFPTNIKSKGLTTSMMTKIGLGVAAAGTLIGAIGSYPFAGFIKQEAIQTLGFAFNNAKDNKDVEGMELALEEQREILNQAPSVMAKVPYANVLGELQSFFEAAQTNYEVNQKVIQKLKEEQERGESDFAVQRREESETARQTQLEQRGRDAEYFRLIREGKFEEAQELLDSELKGGSTK